MLAVVLFVVLPAMWFGRRVRKLSRASQDRVADSSSIAAEVLNAIPTVQSHAAEARESQRFDRSTQFAFETAVRRTRHLVESVRNLLESDEAEREKVTPG